MSILTFRPDNETEREELREMVADLTGFPSDDYKGLDVFQLCRLIAEIEEEAQAHYFTNSFYSY